MAISAVIIPEDPTEPVRREELESDDALSELQREVGGNVQVIEPEPDVSVWMNEEGKYVGLKVNVRATTVFGGALLTGDYIAGNAVVTGGPDSQGRTLGLREGWEDEHPALHRSVA